LPGSAEAVGEKEPPTSLWVSIYQIAGVVGVDPGPLTLRELMAMYESSRDEAWDRTSHVVCMIANCNRDHKKHPDPFSPSDFHPFQRPRHGTASQLSAEQQSEPKLRVPITILKDAWLRMGGAQGITISGPFPASSSSSLAPNP